MENLSEVTRITIERKAYYPDRFRAYKIFIDDQSVATIKAGRSVSFDVPPGDHRLYLKIDWATSNELHFTASSQEELFFICGSNAFSRGFFGVVPMMLAHSASYLWVQAKQQDID